MEEKFVSEIERTFDKKVKEKKLMNQRRRRIKKWKRNFVKNRKHPHGDGESIATANEKNKIIKESQMLAI